MKTNTNPEQAVHVYVLHLEHRTDRKRQFTEAWAAAGYSTDRLHWFPAILGAALPNTVLSQFRTAARTRKARAGRVGCFCSHVTAIEAAIRNDHFPLLILEDDAIPATPKAANIAATFAEAPKDATLLYFGALPVRQRRRVRTLCTRKRRGWSQPPADVQLYGGHAYGIPTAAAATDIVTFLKTHKMTYDSALIRYAKAAPKNAVRVHCPFLFVQSEGYSDIEGAQRGERGLNKK